MFSTNLEYQLLLGLVLSITFARLAWRMRGVTRSGAIAGSAVCFVFFTGAGWPAFAGLVAVFLLAWISTRIGYRRKVRLGTAESRQGRKASQVFANLSIAAVCALLHGIHPYSTLWGEIFALGMVAAFAEAAADTVSSEIGQMQTHARMITTLKKVPSGTDGGISPLGTFAGLLAAVLVTLLCHVVHLAQWRGVAVAIAAAILGMFIDSLLGALLERRGVLNNDSVNFLGTLLAASAAVLFAVFLI